MDKLIEGIEYLNTIFIGMSFMFSMIMLYSRIIFNRLSSKITKRIVENNSDSSIKHSYISIQVSEQMDYVILRFFTRAFIIGLVVMVLFITLAIVLAILKSF